MWEWQLPLFVLGSSGETIYVGKAKNLKNRVTQYFYDGVKNDKVMAMVASIADFYYIITNSEADALSLENNLIKKISNMSFTNLNFYFLWFCVIL